MSRVFSAETPADEGSPAPLATVDDEGGKADVASGGKEPRCAWEGTSAVGGFWDAGTRWLKYLAISNASLLILPRIWDPKPPIAPPQPVYLRRTSPVRGSSRLTTSMSLLRPAPMPTNSL